MKLIILLYFFIVILTPLNVSALDKNPFLVLDNKDQKFQDEDVAPPESFPDEYDPFFIDNTDKYIGEETLDNEISGKTEIKGFFEIRTGIRTQKDQYEDIFSLGEARANFNLKNNLNNLLIKLNADLLYDSVLDRHSVKLEEGTGFIDLRELYVSLTPIPDVKFTVGRQLLAWGTGDLLYINDLFPKDYISLFSGRDESYHKIGSDVCKFSILNNIINFDLVYSPRFDYDRFPKGDRLSYYNRYFNETSGSNLIMEADPPNDWLEDDEWALKIYASLGDVDMAIYGYKGMWKSPAGFEKNSGKGLFPRLNVYGFSTVAPILNGRANFEFGYYDSKNDKTGKNSYIDNSQIRILLGYLMEMPSNIVFSTQYYMEIMRDRKNYMLNLRKGEWPKDEGRHVMTLRIEQELKENQIKLSLFAYYCPTDTDIYIRPSIEYTLQKIWTITAGANFMLGNEDHTYFSQYEHNSNIYIGARVKF